MNSKVVGKIGIALGGIIALLCLLVGGVSYMKAASMTADTACRLANKSLDMAHANEAGVMACHLEFRASEEKREINQVAIMRELDTMQVRQMDLVIEIRKLGK